MKKRIAITGMGVVTSLGNDVISFWESLKKAKSGLSEVSGFDTTKFHRPIGGQVNGFNLD